METVYSKYFDLHLKHFSKLIGLGFKPCPSVIAHALHVHYFPEIFQYPGDVSEEMEKRFGAAAETLANLLHRLASELDLDREMLKDEQYQRRIRRFEKAYRKFDGVFNEMFGADAEAEPRRIDSDDDEKKSDGGHDEFTYQFSRCPHEICSLETDQRPVVPLYPPLALVKGLKELPFLDNACVMKACTLASITGDW